MAAESVKIPSGPSVPENGNGDVKIDANSWVRWSKFVLAELVRLDRHYEELLKAINAQTVEIAQLKVKAGLWGFLAGSIPSLVGMLIYIFTRK